MVQDLTKVQVLAASKFTDKSGQERRVVTMVWEYPRMFHEQVLTHKQFSRCASSSRAIPVGRMLKKLREGFVRPIEWGANKRGMQSSDELTGWRRAAAKSLWTSSAYSAIFHSWAMGKVGLHKQWANRPTEYIQTIRVVVTSETWDNFLELRDHPDTQPEFRLLARKVAMTLNNLEYRELKEGEWHIPFVSDEERKSLTLSEALRVSTSRCARTSYLTHELQKPELEKDLGLFKRLMGDKPIHASPSEHQVTPVMEPSKRQGHSNMLYWNQHRKFVEVDLDWEAGR